MRVTFLAVTKAIKASSQLEGIQSVHLPGRLARRQKHEVAGHTASTVRKLREKKAKAQLTFSFFI